jgi:transposase-like protein
MSELVSIAKAARQLGISPRTLGNRIFRAGIPTMEGMVCLDELKKVAPEIETEAPILEKTMSLRQNAHLHKKRAGPPLSTEDLASTLKRTTSELVLERLKSEKYETILDRKSVV